tara:strand:+ start:157 stop:645 length:489 start_codon:yes stop_codon:yes gene_type:complete
MTTNANMMTIGDRDDFMYQWFQWLPSELKIEIMQKIPGWKSELKKGDFVKIQMNIPDYESHNWIGRLHTLPAIVTEFIFNKEKIEYEYCIEICDPIVYNMRYMVEKKVFWRPIRNLRQFTLKDKMELIKFMKVHIKIVKRLGYYIGFHKSRGQYVPYGVPTI